MRGLPKGAVAKMVFGDKAAEMGAGGGVIISNTTKVDGDFYAIKVLEEAVISACQLSANFTGALAGKTLLAGDVIVIQFLSITLSSGSVIAYKMSG